ncbi:MAG: 4Fe-4S binding protein, partial [Planctomycetota bacterium]
LVLAVPYLWGEASPLFFCRLCPAGALEAALPHTASLAIAGEPVVWPSALKLSILGMLLVGALFVWRPWCTLFCPLGAIFSGMNRVAMVYVDFHESECNDCDVCRKRCNYGGADRRAADNRCVRCLECVGCRALTVGTIFGHRRPSATGSASAPLRLPKALAVGRHRPPPAGAAKRWEAIAVWLRDLLRRPTAAPHRLRQAVPRSDSECDRELVTIQQFTGTAPSVSAEPEKTGLSTQEGAKNGPVPRPDETTPVA